jgi:GH24 family phage-related lysozyme (muramidase)
MAQSRVQVGRLDKGSVYGASAPTQSDLRPQAAPVETYVRPVESQVQASPLSQFMSAISPAIEADAEVRKTDRLKRERKLETNKTRRQYSQLKQASTIIEANLNEDYYTIDENGNSIFKPEYLDMELSDVLDLRRKAVDEYTQQLEGVLDPIMIDGFKEDQEAIHTIWASTVYRKEKEAHNKGKLNNSLTTAMIAVNDQYEINRKNNVPNSMNIGKESIQALFEDHYTANQDLYSGRDELNNLVFGLAIDELKRRSTSPVTEWLNSPLSNNQFGVGKHADSVAKIIQQQEVDASSGFTAAKEANITSMAVDAMSRAFNGDASGINMETDVPFSVNGKNTSHKFTKTDYANVAMQVVADESAKLEQLPQDTPEQKTIYMARQSEFKRKTYEMFRSIGVDTPRIAEAKRNGVPAWFSGDIDSLEEAKDGTMFNRTLQTAEATYRTFEDVYKYQGESGLAVFMPDKEQRDMFNTIRSSMEIGGEDFKSALQYARRYDPSLAPTFSMTTAELADFIDTGIFDRTDMDEATNSGTMLPEVQQRYSMLRVINPNLDEDEAKEIAVDEVSASYATIENSDGSYSLVKKSQFLQSGTVDKNIAVVNTVLKEAVDNADFRAAVNLKLGIEDIVLPLGGDGIANFILTVETNPNNENMLDVRAVEAGDPTNSWFIPMGISLQNVAQNRKSMFVEKTVKDYKDNVANGAEPTVTTEDDETPNLTPSLSMPKIFEEFPAKQIFGEVGEEIKGVVGNVVDATIGIAAANATTAIINDEGHSYTTYIDTEGHKTIGHGLKEVDIEADEAALIADMNNVQPEESAAVVALKVAKIDNYFTDVVEGFQNLPETAKSGMIQMGYQLGRFNVTKEWPKFMGSIKEAAQYAEGSVEQATALAKAKFNMLYNVAEDGKVTATKWATQTKNRAMKVANELASSAGDAATSVFEAVIPKAHADTDLIPQKEQLKVGDVPTASAVVDIALAKNPADAAYKYYGIDENTDEGAAAVKGFFETSVGDWNPDQETVEEFATNKAWCAAFLTQVLRDSGIDTKALFGTDKFDQIRAKAYTNVGTQVEPTQVKAGDVMIKQHTTEERKKFKLGYGHVGIVVKVEGDEVFFIGGNTGDRVTMSSYNMNEKQVDFRRVQNASDIPTESLPSMLELKAGVFTRKAVKKAKNLFTSMYDNIFG